MTQPATDVAFVPSTIEWVGRCRWCGRQVMEIRAELVERMIGTCPFRDCRIHGELVIHSRK